MSESSWSPGMIPKVRAVSRTRDFAAEFEVGNVLAAFSANTQISQDNQNFRELTGPIACLGDYKFEFRLVYGVEKQGALKKEQDIGMYVCRTDSTRGSAFARYEVSVLNKESAKNRKLSAQQYRAFNEASSDGASSWGWCPSFEGGNPIIGLNLAKILDQSQGWLHHGSLRIVCVISIVMGLDKVETTDDESNAQRGVCDSFRALLDSKMFADLTLKVGDEHIRVHSLVLAARSPVFCAMFSAGMRESQEKEVTIADLDVEAVRELISFFYTGEFKKETLESDDSTLALLQAAHRYSALPLVKKCTASLSARFTVETVSERLELADMIGCSVFKEQCLEYMRQQMPEVQETSSYERLVERRPGLLRDVIAAMAGPQSKRRRTVVGGEDTEGRS